MENAAVLLKSTSWKSILLVVLFAPGVFTAQEQPKFGWKRAGAEACSLNATEFKYLRLPSGRLRFEFQLRNLFMPRFYSNNMARYRASTSLLLTSANSTAYERALLRRQLSAMSGSQMRFLRFATSADPFHEELEHIAQ
jgi:hypothetical protein